MNKHSHSDYIEYKNPRLALCRSHIDSPEPGWHTEDKEFLIIGETKEHYMYESYYVEEENRTQLIGVHKDYFIKWLPTQQELF